MLTIKSWAEEDRPREKLLCKGIAALSDAELMAILLSTGSRHETAVELAKRVLALTENNLNELGKLGVRDLTQLHGIGEAKAVSIVAALELGRRRKHSQAPERRAMRVSSDLADYFIPVLADIPHEEFWVLMLNAQLKVLGAQRVAQGGVGHAQVDMRLLLRPGIEQLAHAVVVAHNHPSGVTSPSAEDKALTQNIKSAVRLFNIRLLDHVIVAGNKYFSFADEGLL